MIKPKPITPGDTIGIVAPAGAIKNPEKLNRAVSNLELRGYKVKLASNVLKKKWYFAGEDNERASTIMDFFVDPEINAIFAARGGYGCARILESLDYKIIRENPKIFIGYSDITAFHSAFFKYSDLVTFHGPLVFGDFGANNLIDQTCNDMWDVLEGKKPIPFDANNYYTPVCINPGTTEGQLIGGNLAIICSLMGTKYSLDFEDKILFIEDVGESLYRMDRYLVQLKLSGVFSKVKAVIFGEFSDIVKSDSNEVNRLSPLDVIKDVMKDVDIPAIYGFSCGHSENKTTLPLGVNCRLNCSNGILTFVESFLKY